MKVISHTEEKRRRKEKSKKGKVITKLQARGDERKGSRVQYLSSAANRKLRSK